MSEEANKRHVTPCDLEFAERLESLLRLPLDSAGDVESCYATSAETSDWMIAHQNEISVSVPHHLFHYFDDADIRAKEPGYRTNQENAVRLFIRQLRGEAIPESKRPWWKFW